MDEAEQPTTSVETERTLRSTVLGGAAAFELNDLGTVVTVYAEGAELARLLQQSSLAVVEYRRADPLTGTWVQDGRRREPDPLWSEAGEWNPYTSSEPPYDPLDPTGTGVFKEMGDLGDIRGGCVLDSKPVQCSFLRQLSSYISTVKEQGRGVMETIRSLFIGAPILPVLCC